MMSRMAARPYPYVASLHPNSDSKDSQPFLPSPESGRDAEAAEARMNNEKSSPTLKFVNGIRMFECSDPNWYY